MHFKFHVLAAMLLSSTANAKCFKPKGNQKWKDLSEDDMTNVNALVHICSRISGKTYMIGQTVSGCENVGDDRVDVSIKVLADPGAGSDGSFELKYPDCYDYVTWVKDSCDAAGGELVVVRDRTGDEEAKALVKTDPNAGGC